jgi:uncharacterized membrane protein YoaK (UPF0700 family)
VIRRLERNRSFWENVILAMVLPGVAGAVNASGFIALGVYTSHTSGTVARMGDELAQGRYEGAWSAAVVVLLFLVGAMTATALVEVAGRQGRPRYVVALLVEALMIALFALISIHSDEHWRYQRLELEATLCFAMGLQNALVTRISGAVVRTTHLTGITTDIGIESVRVLFWLGDRLVGRRVTVVPDLKRIRLHVSIFLSFLSGATVGPALYLHFGAVAMLLPVALLLVLAWFDGMLGFGYTFASASQAAPGGSGHPRPAPVSAPRLASVPPPAASSLAPPAAARAGHPEDPQDTSKPAGDRPRLHPR